MAQPHAQVRRLNLPPSSRHCFLQRGHVHSRMSLHPVTLTFAHAATSLERTASCSEHLADAGSSTDVMSVVAAYHLFFSLGPELARIYQH